MHDNLFLVLAECEVNRGQLTDKRPLTTTSIIHLYFISCVYDQEMLTSNILFIEDIVISCIPATTNPHQSQLNDFIYLFPRLMQLPIS